MSVIADIELYDGLLLSLTAHVANSHDPAVCDVLQTAIEAASVAIRVVGARTILDRNQPDAVRDVSDLVRALLELQGRPDLGRVVLEWSMTRRK